MNMSSVSEDVLLSAIKAISEGLEDVDLARNRLDDRCMKELAAALEENSTVKTLHLGGNVIGNAGARELAEAVAKNISLQCLDLYNNGIGDDGAKDLANALLNNTSLQRLSLGWNAIGDEGATALARVLANNVSLESLNVELMNIGVGGAAALADVLASNSSLKELYLGSTGINADGAAALAAALAENSALQELYLEDNKVGDAGAGKLADALGRNQSLQVLNLGKNSIGDDGSMTLAQALTQNTSLQTLLLQENRICPKGAELLASMLAKNASLKVLNLRKTRIGDVGAKYLANAIASNVALQTLALGDNYIGSVGAKDLAAVLATNASLQTLTLEGNKISDDGAKELASVLTKNSSLTTLDLRHNRIGDAGAAALARALANNLSQLENLSLQWNNIGDAGAEALADALASNDLLQELGLGGGEKRISTDIVTRIKARVDLVRHELDDLSAAALQALEADEKMRWGRAKLMVVGKGAVGKTSMIRTLLNQPFNPDHDSTIGVDLTLTSAQDWNERKDIGVADLGKQLAKHKYRRKSFSSSSPQRSPPRSPPRTPPRAPEAAAQSSSFRKSRSRSGSVGFDTEEVAKAVSTSLRLHVKRKAGTPDEEVSFTIWDYGGQEVFYALHHLFLTQYGVYVLVFDMREVLGKERFADALDKKEYAKLASQEDTLKTLRFWIDSIRLHAPNVNVALVGTHLDQVRAPETCEAIHKTLWDTVLKGLGGKPAIVRNNKRELHFFPIDNTDRSDIDETVSHLRAALSNAVADKSFIKDQVPLRWSYCLEKLLSQKEDYVALEAVQRLAEETCMMPKEDVENMLKYMHELGVLVHLTAGQNDVLRQIVVIRPQWLLRNLSRVIRDLSHMERVKKKLLYHEASPSWIEDSLEDWSDRGVVSRDLLEWLWQGQPVDYLVTLMKSMLLACPSPWIGRACPWIGKSDEQGAMLVPSLLRPVDDETRSKALTKLGGERALAYIEFSILPQGVFQRFIASLVQRLPEKVGMGQYGVFSNFASIVFDDVDAVLETSGKRIMLYFEKPANKSLTHHIEILKSSLESIDSSFMKGNLGPELYISSTGSDCETACASARELDKALNGGAEDVPSRAIKSLPLTSFAVFVESREAAQRLLSTEKPFDVFLSHAWGQNKETHKKVKAVAAALEARKIRCWLDENNVGADVLKSMADGVDQSKATVVFVTQTYMDNVNKERTLHDNCRTEFYYALEAHGPANMIPCVLEPDLIGTKSWTSAFRAGWSGLPLYVRMLDGGETKAEIDNLEWSIRSVLRSQEEAKRHALLE